MMTEIQKKNTKKLMTEWTSVRLAVVESQLRKEHFSWSFKRG